MSFLSEKRHKYSNFYNTNKEYYLWFEDFPTPAFLRFSSVDMYISTYYFYETILVERMKEFLFMKMENNNGGKV